MSLFNYIKKVLARVKGLECSECKSLDIGTDRRANNMEFICRSCGKVLLVLEPVESKRSQD